MQTIGTTSATNILYRERYVLLPTPPPAVNQAESTEKIRLQSLQTWASTRLNPQHAWRVLGDGRARTTFAIKEQAVIIWTGWGILAIPLFAIGALGGTALGLAFGLGTGDLNTGAASNAGTVAGLLAAAAATWALGRYLNRPRPGFDPRTGRPITVTNRHRLMLIPLQYVGVAGAVVALVVAGQLLAAA